MNAAPMINACYRHQHPEVFGREEIFAPMLVEAGAWNDELPTQGDHLPATDCGNPECVPLDGEPSIGA